ncbi:hypothetical protein TNCT_92791 [Trichonephila clavata]|uniref:C2H2-type domain-containing protein n=1 Tax=Trichonephila clavata TaxID=2740835 RepID=A0A8X6LBA4_TRICU|nr:hypothetical protein TNCT_92791 [Trichonephila clavata]
MEQSTGRYRCEFCQLHFNDFKQYIDHRYNYHDEPSFPKDDGASAQNSLKTLKTYCEMQIENFCKVKQRKNSGFTDSSSDNLNHPLELSVSKKIQFPHDKITEITTTSTCSRKITGYRRAASSSYNSNSDNSRKYALLSFKKIQTEQVNLDMHPELNTNQPSLSTEYVPLEIFSQGINEQLNKNKAPASDHRKMQFLRYSPISPGTNVMNLQFNTSQQTISRECSPLEICSEGMNEQMDRNQSPAFEHRQMQFLRQGNNENSYAVEPSAISGIRNISESLQQIETNDFEVSRRYNPIPPGTNEMNLQFNTSKQTISLESNPLEFCSQAMNEQMNRNQSPASEHRQMQFFYARE